MFRSLKKRGCATGGANGQARRRARVEAGGAAELGALEALHALEPAVLQQQPEQAPTTSPMATSEHALLVCDCTESRAHLSAADAVSCHPCDQCGVLAPPTSIAQATACVRDELGLPPVAGSTGAVRSTRSRSVLPRRAVGAARMVGHGWWAGSAGEGAFRAPLGISESQRPTRSGWAGALHGPHPRAN